MSVIEQGMAVSLALGAGVVAATAVKIVYGASTLAAIATAPAVAIPLFLLLRWRLQSTEAES
jgi:hypothetical protein